MKTVKRVAAAAIVAMIASTEPAGAQQDATRTDVGIQATTIKFGIFDERVNGIGLRVSHHVVDLLSLDAEANVFPTDNPITGRTVQIMGGAKIGGRSRLFGLFGKLRPGLIRFGRDFPGPNTVCIAIFPTPESCLNARTNFALDYGSVIEIYPSESSVIRIDAGTTYVWFTGRGGANGERQRTGNFQASVGIAARF